MAKHVRWRGARSALAVTVAMGTGLILVSGPSTADVTAVQGSAYGYFSSVSLFGGPPMTRGPAPMVTLPPGGTETVPNAIIQYGPAVLFTSDQITVTSTGTVGPSGSVTSSAIINNINKSTTQPGATGSEVFTADQLSSTCVASESGVTGSTTVVNGLVRTSEGNPDVEGDETYAAVPTNPPPGYTIPGVIEGVGDNFEYIFNEQVINPDGSITVYAAHLRLLGPTAVGDLYLGRVDCGVTVVATTTTTTSSSTTTTTRVPNAPNDKDQCKNGGWQQFGFRNQGQCVSAVNAQRRA